MHFKNLKKDFLFRQTKQKHNIFTIYYTTLNKTFSKQLKITTATRKSKIKTICTVTGLEKSTNLPGFGHSRHVFKAQNSKLSYPGVRKAS